MLKLQLMWKILSLYTIVSLISPIFVVLFEHSFLTRRVGCNHLLTFTVTVTFIWKIMINIILTGPNHPLYFTFFPWISVSLQSVVQVVLCTVDAGIRPCQTVHLTVNAIMQTFFHVSLIVKVRHFPTVFFVIVIVGICGMVTRGYAFGIRSRRSVIEVDLRAILVSSRSKQFLGLLPTIGPAETDRR